MDLLAKIPNSKLKEVFIQKLESGAENDSDIYSELQSVCFKISCELRQINELFPEYTPHDKDYHISHLFKIADIILGESKYEKLNIVELYLLVVTMYAHDWGMAVSKSERYFISTGIKPDGASDLIDLLDDERERFCEFTNKKLGKIRFESDDEIEVALWQEYIRNTHAIRSAKRIQKYFQKINGSIAEALSKICVGHWLDIEDISDRNGYYTDASVLGEIVNLRALTVYIRLIDLFDLAEDRTPYVIWKYVNPQNAYSRMEWSKHRALHQITSPSYESGRVICICGSTDDHEVYASLMDFKFLCEKYFRECSDLLAHMNNEKYELGVYFLDWRIEARNFKPIDIQFTFERENIFEILSQEIYNSHPYVYIRELIQNSIDAISLRKEILDRKKVGGNNIGIISINVGDTTNDDIEIVCQDDGIGMDEYVIKEYFAVLGKSYYQSVDFKNKRLDMSPISKFGIGILSCFAVASQMIIYTMREPYMGEGRECYKVTINDIEKQFRVEELSGYNYDVGTKIILRIKRDKLEKYLEKNKIEIEDFSIKEYVKKVLEFVAYPISINERNETTIVIHPEYDENKLETLIKGIDKYNINKESYEYPSNEMVLIQDVINFNKFFGTRKIDIKHDLGMENVEGYVIFATLKNYDNNIYNASYCWPAREVYVEEKRKEKFRIRWTSEENSSFSDMKYEKINLFSKGVLLENNKTYEYDWRMKSDIFPTPIIKVNYQRGVENISVSRFENKKDNDILKILWKEIIRILSYEMKEFSKEKKGFEYWKIITVYCMQYRIEISDLLQDTFSQVEFPFINCNGEFIWGNIHNMVEIPLLPHSKRNFNETVFINQDSTLKIDQWNYGKCIIAKPDQDRFYKSIDGYVSNSIGGVLANQNYYVKKMVILSNINIDLGYPDFQYILCKEEATYQTREIFKLLKGLPVNYEEDCDKINKVYKALIDSNKLIEFDDDYNEYFAYGLKHFNIDHPITKLLIQYKWMIDELRDSKFIDKLEWAEYNDTFLEGFILDKHYYDDEEKYYFEKINSAISTVYTWLRKYYKENDFDTLSISENDFIPNSIQIRDKSYFITKER
ncbi:HD domain-containing protein [Clostridium tagluense]|uniref:HD domain-containing protein n=1 Tax=Clostridium tagluense TaxID=360422 RepID=UPI001C0D1CC8|nr:ATP-binding protein [Clostridium tagluense]MBU3130622.1 ATP-binding protein [Clostridium tagluense]